MSRKALCIALAALCSSAVCAQSLEISSKQTLVYHTYENGDRIPDYSFCGYMASEAPIPQVEVKVTVSPVDGDNTARIQQAIDYVSSLPVDANGFRGAVLLEKGYYPVVGMLEIRTSGVVLRGSGTMLKGIGKDRATLIRIAGKDNRIMGDTIRVSPVYVPVNATEIPVSPNHGLNVGDAIYITRPSSQEWIKTLGADKIGLYVDYQLTFWEPGDFNLRWERKVVKTSPTSITIDVPLTNSLDPQYGGGYINKYTWAGRIRQVGVENLCCQSEYNPANAKDENHRWMAITVENAEDGWVRRVTTQHFVSSAVAVWESARRFTVEDCKCLSPVGEIGGYRRYAFQTLGQQTLFQRCYAEEGVHDFTVGFSAAGPNAFVQCYSYHPYGFSGTLGGWSSGTLFDRVTVDGGALKIAFRDVDGQGGGWSGANSLCWQCRTPQLHLVTPPTAHNWAFGTWGQGYGDGSHEMPRRFLKPASLYYAQLEARTGKPTAEADKIIYLEDNPLDKTDSSYTTQMSKRSLQPELIMNAWIDTLTARYPLATDAGNAPSIDKVKWNAGTSPDKSKQSAAVSQNTVSPQQTFSPITIINGKLTADGRILTGRTQRTALWRGSTRPSTLKTAGVHLTRFVPGREGTGLTDNLDSVAVYLKRTGSIALNHFPALWYERRRDDHGRSRRVDADVWAPFYEQPFSRSGQGEAFDRLSKYDLNQYNIWYWLRLTRFARIADQTGLLFVQEHYLQHNIIEEGAHWADYPWRQANNVNDLGFPENTYYAGDKRVFMADQFYDITNKKLADYHRQYIFKHLDELGDYNNVVHHLGLEYTGPAHFVKFWLDTIDEWEKKTKRNVKVMLSATKDVQDAILSDAHYAALVDIIDIQQWYYRTDGSLYAPEGGVSLTARQYARIMEVGETDFNGIYRAVSEYRRAYPDKVIVYNARRAPGSEWASFVAGGSLCNIPRIADARFNQDATRMSPLPGTSNDSAQWGMGKASVGYLVYSQTGNITLDLSDDKSNYTVQWINPANGTFIGKASQVKGGSMQVLKSPAPGKALVWLSGRK